MGRFKRQGECVAGIGSLWTYRSRQVRQPGDVFILFQRQFVQSFMRVGIK